MALKQVERVREKVARGFVRTIGDLRNFVSCTDGNAEAVELLRGEGGEMLLAKLTDLTLEHLGNPPTVTSTTAAGSPTRRVVKRLVGA